jgi:hypothetical protein
MIALRFLVGVAEAVCLLDSTSGALLTLLVLAILPWSAPHLVQFLHTQGDCHPNCHHVLGQQSVQLFRWIDRRWSHLGHGGIGRKTRLGVAL